MCILLLLIIYNITQKEGYRGDDNEGGDGKDGDDNPGAGAGGAVTGVAGMMASPASETAIAISNTIKDLMQGSFYEMIEIVKKDTSGAMINLLESANGGGEFAKSLKGSPFIQGLGTLGRDEDQETDTDDE